MGKAKERKERKKRRESNRKNKRVSPAPSRLLAVAHKIGAHETSLWFSLLFLCLLTLFFTLNNVVQAQYPGFVTAFNTLTARLAAGVLHALNVEVTVEGIDMRFADGFRIRIIYECTGIFALVLVCCFFLSFPLALPQRFFSLCTLIAALYAFNILRIATLGLVYVWSPARFPFFIIFCSRSFT